MQKTCLEVDAIIEKDPDAEVNTSPRVSPNHQLRYRGRFVVVHGSEQQALFCRGQKS